MPPRLALLCSLAVAVVVLLVYLRTLIPTAVDQDSGELVAAAHTLGIAHPTGYPLWTLLGRLCDLLPVGHTSAYRVALASALPAAAASGIVCWLVITSTGSLLPGVFSGLAFGLWFPTWSQAVLAEVYGLSGLLFSLFLVALWRWSRSRSVHSLLWLALIGGAVSMHHRTAFLSVAPVLATAFWLTRPRRTKTWVVAALLFLAPFALYLYLPIRASMHPAVNWTNPTTFDRFYAHAMGTQYTHFALQNSAEEAMKQASKLVGESLAGGIGSPPPGTPFASPEPVLLDMPALRLLLSIVLMLIGLPLIVWGWWAWYRRQPPEALSVAVGCVVLCLWVVAWGETSDLKVFLLPLGAVLALCGGLGLAQVAAMLRGLPGRLLAAALGLAAVVILLGANWSRSDRSNEWRYRDEWYAALAQMEKNAIFITDFDVPTFVTIYLQNVEGFRRDVTHLGTVGLSQPWYVQLIADLELRQVADRSWQRLRRDLQITSSHSSEFHVGTALLGGMLAEHYRGRRPVYVLHGPSMSPRPGPPYCVGLSEDLVQVTFTPVSLALAESVAAPLARLSGGAELAAFAWDGPEAGAGELLGFRTSWLSSPSGWFSVLLVPEGKDPAAFRAETESTARFQQSYPLLYGQESPAQPGPWEQRGSYLIPSNAPGGEYRVLVSYSPGYPPQFSEWTPVGTLTVHAR